MMSTLMLTSSFPSSPIISNPNPLLPKSLRARHFRCLRRNGEAKGLFKNSSQMELEDPANAEISQERLPPNGEIVMKGNDIWRLFKEAQRNILYLNKQRLMALEELNKITSEKNLLLERIEQLESEKHYAVGRDPLSICWELLLRIDSMVVNGVISIGEASEMRRMVLDHKVSIADSFIDILQKRDAELLAELRQFSDRSKKNGLHIIHICTEMDPVVSIGTLGPYVTGLSRALQRKGNLVEVILPKYANLDLGEVQGLRETKTELYSYFNGRLHGNRIWTGVVYGIGVTFIQPLSYSSFFTRERVYGYADDFERFVYFSRASLDYIVKSGKQPDILHVHNWETAIIAPLFWDIFVKQGLEGTRILFTCQDFRSQGLEQPEKLALCGLDPAALHRPDRLQDNTKTHLLNILKGGIVYSNKVVILSSIHSKGKTTHSLTHGLEPTLKIHREKLVVSPYGFDNSSWDPAKDTLLPKNYSAEDIDGKTACKVALHKRLGFAGNSSSIVVGCFLSEISDVDLKHLTGVVRNATKRGVQFILVGTSTTPSINRLLESSLDKLQDENVRFICGLQEALSHLIFAGSDIILYQFFNDPILQVPLKALKYGAAPITETDNDNKYRHFADNNYETTKFARFIDSTFRNMSLSQALDEIKKNPSEWKRKIIDGMEMDFSWDAESYDIHISAYTAIKNL